MFAITSLRIAVVIRCLMVLIWVRARRLAITAESRRSGTIATMPFEREIVTLVAGRSSAESEVVAAVMPKLSLDAFAVRIVELSSIECRLEKTLIPMTVHFVMNLRAELLRFPV